mmetsp:Transcript_24536/g.72716  ORF Transcript_24536/g.72716 Transcript_24536/m.72716 type:complete len:237 (-) Transcript_24536:1130-1840(-)
MTSVTMCRRLSAEATVPMPSPMHSAAELDGRKRTAAACRSNAVNTEEPATSGGSIYTPPSRLWSYFNTLIPNVSKPRLPSDVPCTDVTPRKPPWRHSVTWCTVYTCWCAPSRTDPRISNGAPNSDTDSLHRAAAVATVAAKCRVARMGCATAAPGPRDTPAAVVRLPRTSGGGAACSSCVDVCASIGSTAHITAHAGIRSATGVIGPIGALTGLPVLSTPWEVSVSDAGSSCESQE